jgi:hypothetical protein
MAAIAKYGNFVAIVTGSTVSNDFSVDTKGHGKPAAEIRRAGTREWRPTLRNATAAEI